MDCVDDAATAATATAAAVGLCFDGCKQMR